MAYDRNVSVSMMVEWSRRLAEPIKVTVIEAVPDSEKSWSLNQYSLIESRGYDVNPPNHEHEENILRFRN